MLIALHTAKRINLNLKAILEQMMKLRKNTKMVKMSTVFMRQKGFGKRSGRKKGRRSNSSLSGIFDPDTENIYIDDEVKDETKSYEKIIPYHTKGVLGRWTWSRQKMLAEKYKLIVKLTSGEYKLYRKTYSDEDTGRLPYSIITNALIDSKIGRTELGSLEIKEIMGDKVFDYPKFSGLIKYFLETGSDKDSIVLDFFSGSATTAHAVLDLNREDGGNRKFILIEQMNYINTVENQGLESNRYSKF